MSLFESNVLMLPTPYAPAGSLELGASVDNDAFTATAGVSLDWDPLKFDSSNFAVSTQEIALSVTPVSAMRSCQRVESFELVTARASVC